MAYIRKFKTTSGATGVQVCYKEQGKVVRTVHVGSAQSERALEKLMKQAQGIIDGEKTPLFDLEKFDAREKRRQRAKTGNKSKKRPSGRE